MADQEKKVIEGGYIILARKIIDSEIWEKPATWVAIWIHILLKVNWKDTPRMEMAQGYFSWPIEKPFLKGVTERQWGNVLLWLKNKEMIKKQKKKLGCVITVCNYERYQDPSLYGKGTEKGKKKELKGNKKGTLIREEGNKGISKTTWLTPFANIWYEILGGEIPYGQSSSYLKPLEDKHGTSVVCDYLKNYLLSSDHQFLSLAKFSQTFGKWGKKKSASMPKYGKDAQAHHNEGGTGKVVL